MESEDFLDNQQVERIETPKEIGLSKPWWHPERVLTVISVLILSEVEAEESNSAPELDSDIEHETIICLETLVTSSKNSMQRTLKPAVDDLDEDFFIFHRSFDVVHRKWDYSILISWSFIIHPEVRR